MMLPTLEQLEQLDRTELLPLTQQLLVLVAQLQVRVAELEAEVAKLHQPPPTSRNSSQPPSRDHKPNQAEHQPKKKHGPPFGHQRHTRSLVENPDRVLSVGVAHCAQCQSDLRSVAAENIIRRQVTELPQVKPLIIETQQAEVRCPLCQQLNRGELPAGLE